MKSCITSRPRNYGNYGIFLFMGNAGCLSSTGGDVGDSDGLPGLLSFLLCKVLNASVIDPPKP